MTKARTRQPGPDEGKPEGKPENQSSDEVKQDNDKQTAPSSAEDRAQATSTGVEGKGDPESADPSNPAPETVPTGAVDQDNPPTAPAPAVPEDAESDDESNETPGTSAQARQSALTEPGTRFDGTLPAGNSNMSTDDDEPENDVKRGVGQTQGNMYGEEGVGALSPTGHVDPGGSNAEFSDDEEAERGTPARSAGQTEVSSGPLDAPPSGYSNEVGEETYSRDAYQAEAGPRPEDDRERDDDTALVDEEGNSVSAGDLFTEPEGPQTFVYAKTRIFETFTYPNTTETAKRLLFAEGARVGLAEAEAVKARA